MSRAGVQEAVYVWLESFVRPLGFMAGPKRWGLYREFAGGVHTIGASVINDYPGFAITFLVSVRIDAIQDILVKFLPIAADFQATSDSISILLDRIAPDEPTSFPHFDPNKDVFPSMLANLIVDKTIPFLTAITGPESIDHIVNETNLCHLKQPNLAMVGAIAARLARNPKCSVYFQRDVSVIRALPETEQVMYFNLLKYLDSHVFKVGS